MNEKTAKYTDRELFQQVSKGDETSLTILYTKYRNRLLRESYFILGDTADAEDTVQEVFVAVWNKRKSIKVEDSFLPYLLQSTWNKSLTKIRDRTKKGELEEIYQYVAQKSVEDHPFEREELAQLLDKALQLVPPAARRSFMLQYMEGFNQQSVALQQNISLQVVKNNVSLALRILRQALGTKRNF
jgi:RNA polymerase sigma-70 factor (ECF subfamily)